MNTELQKQIDKLNWWHTIKFPGGEISKGDNNYNNNHSMKRYLFPEDLTGKSVLDVGAYDGFWSAEAKSRGAEIVVCTDLTIRPTIKLVSQAFNLDLLTKSVDWNNPNQWEKVFDTVLCYGLVYHLYNPIQGIINCMRVGHEVIIESAINQPAKLDESIPVAWINAKMHDNDNTNYFIPNMNCLRESAFVAAKVIGKHIKIVDEYVEDTRATIKVKVYGN